MARIATRPCDLGQSRGHAQDERVPVDAVYDHLPSPTSLRPVRDLRHALREYERQHYNLCRTRRSLAAAAPLRTWPQPLETDRTERLTVGRQDRLGGVIHEYPHAACGVAPGVFGDAGC